MIRRTFLQRSAAFMGMGALGSMTESAHAEPSLEQFQAHQSKRRKELWSLLGDLPLRTKPQAKLLKSEKFNDYTLEHLELDLNGQEAVPAYLLLPDNRPQPAPGLIYLHAHGGSYPLGKEELRLGRKVMKAYAPICAAKGLVTLAIDSWGFSGRMREEDAQTGERVTFKLMLW